MAFRLSNKRCEEIKSILIRKKDATVWIASFLSPFINISRAELLISSIPRVSALLNPHLGFQVPE